MTARTVILSVDESKADGLVEALSKRDYISVVGMDREARKRLRDCPCCQRRLSKEITYTINDKMMFYLLGLVQKMAVAKTVILINKDTPAESVPPVEQELCSPFEAKMLWRAEALGLVKPFVDGSRTTYFTDALSFLRDEEGHGPSWLVTLDGDIVETGGHLWLRDIKFKDEIAKDRLRRDFMSAIKAIPQSTITFVEMGQMSLV